MANGLYDTGREAFLAATVDWDADDIRIILYDEADGASNLATHDFLNDVVSGGRVAVSSALGSKTTTAGVADAADVTWTSVTGDVSESIICYKHTGTESTSALVFRIDTATGLPVTPNGGNIVVAWDNGSNKIFKL